jgi:hypothetical protein
MMSKRSVHQRKPPTPKVPPPDLSELLTAVESQCNRAAFIAVTTARLLTGAEQSLHVDGVPEVHAAALQRVSDELEGLADRALKARVGDAA